VNDTQEPFLRLTDSSLGLSDGDDDQDRPITKRRAARGIVFNDKNKIALVYVSRHGHHKLPGGGIEDGESWTEALKREALEEIGCKIEVRDLYVGTITEERTRHRLQQISLCGIADVVEIYGQPSLTESEINDGLSAPLWVSLEKALELFEIDRPTTYSGTYMHVRDKAFIEKAVGILTPQNTKEAPK